MDDPWFVEIVIDSGQRLTSDMIDGAEAAARIADDMAGRVRVVAVTMIQCGTGECITKPSHNLMAGVPWLERCVRERDMLAEALAPCG